jgi:hypothetical protein
MGSELCRTSGLTGIANSAQRDSATRVATRAAFACVASENQRLIGSDTKFTEARSQAVASSRAIAGPSPLAISFNTLGTLSVNPASALRCISSVPSAATSRS